MAIYADYYILETLEQDVLKLDLIKSYLRVEHDEDDILIRILARSALEYAENFTNISIRKRLIEAIFYHNRTNKFNLPKTPILKIEKVVINDKFPHAKELKKEHYRNDENYLYLDEKGKYKENFSNVTITYNAGYEHTNLPGPLGQSLLSHISLMYDNRCGETPMPTRILNNYYFYKKARL